MQLHHEFTVPVPVDDVWPVLLDVEGIAPCLPGAAVEGVDGDTITGSVKVKVGPITVAYRGTADIRERDSAAHRIVLVASGKEVRGQGTARAVVTATLSDRDGGAAVAVDTDLTITGRPAQFGRGVMAEVGERIIDQFAACLAKRMRAASAAPSEAQPSEAQPSEAQPSESRTSESRTAEPEFADFQPVEFQPGESEPLDLLRLAGAPVAKRAAAALAVAGLALLAFILIRRHR
ncbi:carbon monoxide dehydrogenase subunit G [Streptacidiphilus sp. MAP12-16]|uniref:SRPBCC family protein n=1 Tax=Streptacidiphilus sp. MAP12-16 TaxID=3156300 RepID=UPI003517AD63